ncbi:hypothetical protein GCM10009689_10650 [Brevibacterium antiquum]
MDDEFDGTRLEFVGVFHWHERISFFQSPCLYYPRSGSHGLLDHVLWGCGSGLCGVDWARRPYRAGQHKGTVAICSTFDCGQETIY